LPVGLRTGGFHSGGEDIEVLGIGEVKGVQFFGREPTEFCMLLRIAIGYLILQQTTL
jgi:hypothetical protein